MLGRLEKDVDECIAAYNELSADVFARPRYIFPISFSAKIASRFDSAKLKRAVLQIIASRGLPNDAPFDDGQDRGCKVFVCAASKDLMAIDRLRSYSYPWKKFPPCTIYEAALATSAASGFFKEVKIGARRYVDGALGANNPVEQVEGEASDVWCREGGELKPLVKCFVSIGTGNPGKKPIEDRVDRFISETLVGIATETEKTAALFIKRWRQHYDERRFFRFNVEQGLQNVGLAEHDKRGVIETATEQYMADVAQESRVRECAQNLKEKQDRPRIDLVAIVQEYKTLTVLRKHDGSQAARSRPRHFIPLPKNPKFVGRASILHTLKEKLFGDDNPASQRIALVGLGGIGKTQVALEMAYWAKENRPEWSIFWVPALNMTSFEQACRDMAQLLQLNGAEEDAKELVQRYLDSDASGRWLLIIDNFDDENLLKGGKQGISDFLPRTNRGRILLTTRFRRIAVWLAQSEVADLSQMDGDEAKELLRNSLVDKSLLTDENNVAELLMILTYLPLAIAQAAVYLNETMTSVAEYIRLLQNTEGDMVELLETEFADDTRHRGTKNAVAKTWAVSFKQIRRNADAALLLSFIAQVEFKAIPRLILPPVGSEQRMTRAIGVLCGYSFLSKREVADTYDMHRLVHVASRAWVAEQNDVGGQRRAALVHLEEIFPIGEWEKREGWRLLLPHVLKAIEVDEHDNWSETEGHLGFRVGRCLLSEGRSLEAVKVLEQVVAFRKTTLDETHPDRLASQHELGTAYRIYGRTKDALEVLEQVVAVREMTLPETSLERLLSQHELAGAYRADGQAKQAIRLLERVVAIQETFLNERHPDRLDSQHELARVYRADGQVNKAIELLEKIVAVREKTLAETHPDRLASQHVLAMAYHAGGYVKRAISLLEMVVAVQETSLHETHPDRLDSLHELARAYRADGELKQAINLLEQVVELREFTQAETHPDRLASQHVLAVAYQADGRPKEAIRLLEQVVAVEAVTLGEAHPDRYISQDELARAYQADKQAKAAIEAGAGL